jgi:hypothetical protein
VTTAYATELLATSHNRDLRRQACAARLATLARCCTPSAAVRAARRATEAVGRLRDAVTRRSAASACCTA